MQSLHPSFSKTFNQYKEFFWKHIKAQSVNCCRVDLVFDCYLEESLKSTTRNKRGLSATVLFKPTTVLPRDWNVFFLCNSTNKTNLFRFLVQKDASFSCHIYQDVIATFSEEAVAVNLSDPTSNMSLALLTPCNHEEADTKVFLHCLHASSLGIENALIQTVDCDVLVLSIHYFNKLGLSSLWLRFGVGKHVKFITVHEIANSLPPKYALGLPFFHAFTGCDTTSAFENYGKKSAWNCWLNSDDAISDVFGSLSLPSVIHDNHLKVLEKFVIQMYNKKVTVK